MNFADIITRILGFLIVAIFIITLCSMIVFEWNNVSFREVMLRNFQVTVLLPVAALFALVLISLFQSIAGKIEFEALGMKFSGASGPIVMWVLTFSCMSFWVYMLWK